MDCYAKKGDIHALLSLFRALKTDAKMKITNTIYCIVINGCAHSGLIDEALLIFDEIKGSKSNIDPKIITALIDCLGRKGVPYLDRAETLYNTEVEHNPNIYYRYKLHSLLSLLSSCRTHNELERGQRISDKIEAILKANKSGIDNGEAVSSLITLSNLYGQNKDFAKVSEIRQLRRQRGLKKKAGISWIEIEGETHTFMANDRAHKLYDEIAKERERLKHELKSCGHVFDESIITRELGENESSEDHLCGHSEKSALICGLIMTPTGVPLVIAKNLRICKDCHNVFKLVSHIRNRKISVRDKNRWHIFENGQCSCCDYF